MSEFYFNEAIKWENIEYDFKRRFLPRIKQLFGQFFDIRKRPIVRKLSSLALLRQHIREHLDCITPDYSDRELAEYLNQATHEIVLNHALSLGRGLFGND